MDGREHPTGGSLDQAESVEQMAATDVAMRHYFNAEDWVTARGKAFPGLRRGGHLGKGVNLGLGPERR